MQNAMNLETLLNTVITQTSQKKDYLADTDKALTMLFDPESKDLRMLLSGSDGIRELGISDQAHDQIAGRLGIPLKYYKRLLNDHGDMVAYQVNELFEREPETRMIRVLDGKVRAFLSANYRRVDNDKVLENMLPQLINGDMQTIPLSTNVTDNKMYLKVLFDDDRLKQEIGTVRGEADVVQPGFILSNSETGQGSLSVKGFFYRSYCTNGCHFGGINAVEYKRSHRGGRLINESEYTILSPETEALEDQLIWSQATDVIKGLSSPEVVQKLGDNIRAANNTATVEKPTEAVDAVARELGIRESEKTGVLESFLQDGIYSKWGMVNAITEQANRDDISYDRATELEALGGKLLDFTESQWNRIAVAA